MSSFPSGHQLPSPSSQQSGGITINLSSNNPFRNRATSPSLLDAPVSRTSATSPFDDPPPYAPPPAPSARPVSRNPFLDQQSTMRSSAGMSATSDSKSLSAEDIFDSLTLDDKKTAEKQPMLAPAQRRGSDRPTDRTSAPRRREDQPPSGAPSSRHRPTRSQEEALRARRMLPPSGRPGPAQSPQRKTTRRPRRNSESSVLDLDNLPLTEEEKRMIEARRRRQAQAKEDSKDRKEGQERREGREDRKGQEARDGKDGKDAKDSKDGKDSKGRTKPGRPSRRMDIIDQLDATSIYGTGLFHHDGPFDALNPHRNRNTSRRAPMQAFPKDSLNNSLVGGGPAQFDHNTFMGHGSDEAFRDYAGSARHRHGQASKSKGDAPIFDPVARGDIIHGDQSDGLGTSTFLEGTPAARVDIARQRQERTQEMMAGGLQRKKSLAQRIRHINKGPREFSPSGRITNPEDVYSRSTPDPMPSGAGSAGVSEANPFFSDFSKGEENINVRPRDGGQSPASPPPFPGEHLERRATIDATSPGEDAPKSSGILGRMKSLKGGRKPRIQQDLPGTAV